MKNRVGSLGSCIGGLDHPIIIPIIYLLVLIAAYYPPFVTQKIRQFSILKHLLCSPRAKKGERRSLPHQAKTPMVFLFPDTKEGAGGASSAVKEGAGGAGTKGVRQT
jgi:hypothetical protein